jgi:hypothetical protein
MLINLRDKVFFRPDHPAEVDRITYWVGKSEEPEERSTMSSKILNLLGNPVAIGDASRSTTSVLVRKDVFPPEKVMAMADEDIIVAMGNQRIKGKRLHASSHANWKDKLQPIPMKDLVLRDVSGAYADIPRDTPVKSHWDGVDSTAPVTVEAKKKVKVL